MSKKRKLRKKRTKLSKRTQPPDGKVIKHGNILRESIRFVSRHSKVLVVLLVFPLLTVAFGTFLVDYLESDLSLRFDTKNGNSDYVFSFSNNSKINMVVLYAGIGVKNAMYRDKSIADLAKEGRAISINEGKATMLIIDQEDFVSPHNYDVLENIIGITIKPGEEKRVIVEDVKRGEPVFVADFYIEYLFVPSNKFFLAMHRILQTLGSSRGAGRAFFRLQEGQIIDIATPPHSIDFNRMAIDKLMKRNKAQEKKTAR